MMMDTHAQIRSGDRLIGIDEVKRKTSLSTSSIYRQRGKTFPDNFRLKGTARVVWLESEVEQWIAQQLAPSG
jgi:prophage regulatory protein